ncbi:MAG: AMP-binding protein, partial [Actinomycetota bacterium]
VLTSVAGPDDTVVALVGFDAVGATLALASAMADRCVTFVDVDDDPDRLVARVRSLGSIVIADHEHVDALAALPLDIATTTFDAAAEADPAGPWSRPSGERLARILSTTSGTTGAPKAALLPPDRWKTANGNSIADTHRACRLTIAAIGSYAFVTDCVKVASTGNTIAMLSPKRASMLDIVSFLESARVTSLSVTSTFTTAAVRITGGRPLAADITLFNVRGERVSGDHVAQARTLAPAAVVSAQYASTEMGHVARINLRPDDPLPEPGLPVAMPLEAGVRLRWIDDDGTIVESPPDGPAELVVRPLSLFEGYVGRDDDRVEIDGEIWFRSGDLAQQLPDGRLRVYGRIGRRMKVGGQFVDLDDVASSFEAVPEVALASVTGFDDPRTGTTRLVAHVVATDGAALDPVGLRAGLAERLPIFMVPSLIHVVDDPPMARTGKLDERALAAWRPPTDTRPAATNEDYSSVTEAALQVVAGGLTGVLVRPDDDLIDAGMTSLDWIEVQTRLRRDFDTEVALPDLYAAPTVRRIAALVTDDRETPPLAPLRTGDATPSLLWVLLGLGAHEAVGLSRALPDRTTWVPTPREDRPDTIPVEPAAVVADLVERARATLAPGEPALVAGFSTGTAHARAVAARLAEAGHRVPLLVLLDPPAPRPRLREEPRRWVSHVRRRFHHWRKPPGPPMPASEQVFLRQRIAATRWEPPAWTGPTLVVRSDEFADAALPTGLSGPVSVHRIPGGHFDVLAAGDEIAEMIERTLDDLG